MENECKKCEELILENEALRRRVLAAEVGHTNANCETARLRKLLHAIINSFKNVVDNGGVS